jgi:N-acetylglucosaminyldiphosphoundecaprenol N-acetyl-beta-D-mannosaminyltransferase
VTYAANLRRDVYCVLGLPIDAIDMVTVVTRIEAAAKSGSPFLITTPNLNFLVQSRTNSEFRESILGSDLCPADGMPIVWIARIIGVPINERVSGSDIFEAMKIRTHRLGVFFFGGVEGAAAAAANALNGTPTALSCVGTLYPGFCSVVSKREIIEAINSSNADFLAVSLGANKGQLWLQRNRQRLTIPVRVHLGATLNFQAGLLRRAPRSIRNWGLEWLWRIKEEPHLWRRYWHDGCVLIRLFVTRILPLAAVTRWHRLRSSMQSQDLSVETRYNDEAVTISLSGVASERHIEEVVSRFESALIHKLKFYTIDMSKTRYIDSRFLGVILMFRKNIKEQGAELYFIGVSHALSKIMYLNGADFLLASGSRPNASSGVT